MATDPRVPATARDLDATPDDGRICEILDGQMEVQPRPRPGHNHVASLLTSDLVGPFHRGRVRHYWLSDPEARTFEALEAREGSWLRLGGWTDGDVVRVAPFEAIEIEVGALFVPLPAPPDATP